MSMIRMDENEAWLVGVKSIAGFLNVSSRTIERWLRTDETDFPVYRIGGRWSGHPAELRRWQRRKGNAR